MEKDKLNKGLQKFEKTSLFKEIKKAVIASPGIKDSQLKQKFGDSLECSEAIVSLLSGNWIDPDGNGGYVFRPEPTKEEIEKKLDVEPYSGDYPWEV